MVLSHVGVIADILWYEIKNHAKNVELDAFVVMPNHIHGILILNDPDPGNSVETGHALFLPTQTPPPTQTPSQKRYQNQGKNTISSMTGSYKSAVTRNAHRLGWDFEWQSRFYDHIIRDDASFERIKNYIITNPKNWKEDKFFPPE
jgi:putative transposase